MSKGWGSGAGRERGWSGDGRTLLRQPGGLVSKGCVESGDLNLRTHSSKPGGLVSKGCVD